MWTKIEDALPESGIPVLVCVTNVYGESGKYRRLRAQYAAPKTLEMNFDQEGGVYDENTETYYCEEGWYETNEFEETHWAIDGVVTHWMPLPEPPNIGDKT